MRIRTPAGKPAPIDAAKLKSFSRVMAAALLLFGSLGVYRHGFSRVPAILLGLAAGFACCGMLRPQWLAPVYRFWMGLASVLSWVNTRILLVLIYYLLVTPIGLCMRLFGSDPLRRRLEKDKPSYWLPGKPRPQPADYEKQF